MGPECPLPLSSGFSSADGYVESLLSFVKSSELLNTLCGGVHILDFYTRSPDLYTVIVPEKWRDFFRHHDIMHILDLFMREDLDKLSGQSLSWRDGPAPPECLLSYLRDVRKHSFRRKFTPIDNGAKNEKLARNVALGMKVKKIHEVDHFSRYVEKLTAEIADSGSHSITHLVDFGSGQGYLPRCLASPPYNRHLVAVESKQHNIEGARNWDVMAKLAPKPTIMRDKKAFRAQQMAMMEDPTSAVKGDEPASIPTSKGEQGAFIHPGKPTSETATLPAKLQISTNGAGSVQYVEHWIHDGDLSQVIDQIVDQDAVKAEVSEGEPGETLVEHQSTGHDLQLQAQREPFDPKLMVISLHSCGNLVHHGIRSLLLNPAVSAVALVGCCYNLVTERLGPPTYKLPSLRAAHPRLEETANAFDPHGFPMSERLCSYETMSGKGLRLNITARMMAVQAPYNWGEKDSAAFFTRHFFRALLQRIFLDLGIVDQPKDNETLVGECSPAGWSGNTAPIMIGSLRKSCYADFVSYVRGAQAKLVEDPVRGTLFEDKLSSLSNEDIRDYERRYTERKKELSVVWSLMAFSAGVIEAVIVTDRWLFLTEQEEVSKAWVEPVFDYKHSPRNLVVVGVKK